MTRRFGRVGSAVSGPAVPQPAARDEGMVTAEFAVALPAFVVVVLLAFGGVAVMTAQLRCVDAAEAAARLAARGDPVAVVHAMALRNAPGGSTLSVTTADQLVTATVQAKISLPGLRTLLPGITVRAHVTDPLEPGLPT